MTPPRKYRAVIAYDGADFSGWQRQSNAIGVQQVVEDVVSGLDGAPVTVFGSSRTDAGVHADGFVAHFNLATPIPPSNLVRAVNARLPPSIRFLRAAYAPESFDARLSATGKEYRYRIWRADVLPPALARYWTFCHRPLDVEAMREAAAFFVGRHDFTPFSVNPGRTLESAVRTVHSFTVSQSGKRIVLTVRGDGFLYKQVRSMAGFLLSVGRGCERPEAVKELLDAAQPRTARVETAPPQGLVLARVFYPRSAIAMRRPKAPKETG